VRAHTTITTTTTRSGAALVVAVITSVLVSCSSGGPSARPVADRFATAWSRGDMTAAASETDNAGAARPALESWKSDLQVDRATFKVRGLSGSGDHTAARVTADVELTGLGRWRYDNTVALRQVGKRWVVAWSPAVLYPGLRPGQSLARTRALPPRAPVLDRNAVPLLTPTAVVTVGVVPSRLGDPTAPLATLQRTTGADPTRVRAAIAAAKPDSFVPVITLRRPAFDAVKAVLNPIPGVLFQTQTVDLAPTPTFALPVLGKVGPATAEALKAAGPGFEGSDAVGLNGLEGLYQRRLAGTPSGSVAIVDANGRHLRELYGVQGGTGQAVRTTLDVKAQSAAEQALAGVAQPAALVAVQASTGQVLAVANAPADSTYDRALAGRYPPGSSFKVVTAAALLQAGVTLDTVVPCPARAVVGGKPFTNFEGEAPGPVPFLTDFARSCNTAFVGLASRLAGPAFADTTRAFGIGAKWSLPLTAFSGQFPAQGDAAEVAAASIGQAKVLASPLAMSLVAATAATGTWHAPTLVVDPAQGPAATPSTIPAEVVNALQQLMRAVVTSGTGTAANVVGPPVYGKTGTAEFGPGTPPATHAWFIGFRGDMAFAVLVEGGGVGGRVAAPIAARFLAAT
jgi:cell division protein FtsI/penicillin-binding protein 2